MSKGKKMMKKTSITNNNKQEDLYELSSDTTSSYLKVEQRIVTIKKNKDNVKALKDISSNLMKFTNELIALISDKAKDIKIPEHKEDHQKSIEQQINALIESCRHPLKNQEQEKHDILCINFKYKLNGIDKTTQLFFYDDKYVSNHQFGAGNYKKIIDPLLIQLKSKSMPEKPVDTICAVNNKGIRVNPENKKDSALHFDKQKEYTIEGKRLALLAIQDKEEILAEILCPTTTDIKIFSNINDDNPLYSQILACCEHHTILVMHDLDLGLELSGVV